MTESGPKVVGASCLSNLSLSWRGVGQAIVDRSSRDHRASHEGTLDVAIAGIPADRPKSERMAERLMSRSAVLGHLATCAAVADAGWVTADSPPNGALSDVGLFMGVGASGGSVSQLQAMLSQSIDNGEFSLHAFGRQGLRACNPLYAFQLMNNFAMCHAAILGGMQGPNAALFSRGGGTVMALSEALFVFADDHEDCHRVLVGGADCATDPVTHAELARHGFCAEGLVPAEGAAILALSDRAGDRALATVKCSAIAPLGEVGLKSAVASALPDREHARGDLCDLVVSAGWGPARQAELAAIASELAPAASVVDVTREMGESLAATPALAWVVAIDLLQGNFDRALVLTCGIDDHVGAVLFHAALEEASA